MHWPWGRIQRAGALALGVLSVAAVALHASCSPDVPFVIQSASAPWITAPGPVSAALQQWGHERAPVVVFRHAIELAAPPADAALELRALRGFSVRVNGAEPPHGRGDGAHWRRWRRVPVGPLLRPGANEVEVAVENLHGPPLLQLRGQGLALSSADPWQVSVDGRPAGAAQVADDTRPDLASRAVETPLAALRRRAPRLVALWAVGTLAAWALASWLPGRQRGALPSLALGAAALAWTGLFAAKISRIPLGIGFDARHHLLYVEFLRNEHALPLATDGWSMYHPPLFYALAALLEGLGQHALQAIPWFCGLGSVFVAHALALRLLPGRWRAQTWAVAFAAVLPMNLTASAYFSNEAPHALLAGVALVVGVDALLAPRASLRQALALGLWLGLAALTKFTALALVPVAVAFLALKVVALERAPLARAAGLAAAAAGTTLAIAGWFYARSWVLLGSPLVGNWSLPQPGQVWWQQPGFHTPAYYLGFGEALSHPYLAGFHSFWDGLYSTLWGDGGVAGRMFPADRHGFWSYDWMSAGYLLALPLSALLAWGGLRCTREALGGRDAGLRAALSFALTAAWTVGVAILYLTLSLPYFAQAKAFYGLCAMGPLAVCFGAGAEHVDDALARAGPAGLRQGFAGLLVAALGALFLGYAA